MFLHAQKVCLINKMNKNDLLIVVLRNIKRPSALYPPLAHHPYPQGKTRGTSSQKPLLQRFCAKLRFVASGAHIRANPNKRHIGIFCSLRKPQLIQLHETDNLQHQSDNFMPKWLTGRDPPIDRSQPREIHLAEEMEIYAGRQQHKKNVHEHSINP